MVKPLYVFKVKGQDWALSKPTRSEIDDIEMFYAKEFSKCLRANIATKSQIRRHFVENGSALTDGEETDYIETCKIWNEKQNEILRLSVIEEEGAIKKLHELKSEIIGLLVKIQQFESIKNDIFKNSAEDISRGKTLVKSFFTVFHKVEQETGGGEPKYTRYFDGTYEENLDKYEEERPDEEAIAVERGLVYTSMWYSGRAQTEEDFENIEKILNPGGDKGDKLDTGEVEDEPEGASTPAS